MQNKAIKVTILQYLTSQFFVRKSICCISIVFMLVSLIFCISYNIVSSIHDNDHIESFVINSTRTSQKTILTHANLYDSMGALDNKETACESEEELELKCELISEIVVGDLGVCHVFLSNHLRAAVAYSKNEFITTRKSVLLQV